MSTNRRDFLKGSTSLSLIQLSHSGKLLGLNGIAPLPNPVDTPSPSATIGHPLMVPNLGHSLAVRCLSKPVLASRIIDDMETDQGWTPSPVVKLSYTTERARSGAHSMRFT